MLVGVCSADDASLAASIGMASGVHFFVSVPGGPGQF